MPPDRKPFAWNRHGEPQKAWQFTPDTAWPFAQLPGQNWYVFNGELLHNKTRHIKQVNYLFDILVYDGELLTGTTYKHRYEILKNTFVLGPERFGHYEIVDHLWLARNYTNGLADIYKTISAPEDEGLVLKDPNGIWRYQNSNAWMAKITRRNG